MNYNEKMFEVRQIKNKDIPLLESQILKVSNNVADLDRNSVDQSFHFGIYRDECLLGMCSFCNQKIKKDSYESIYKLYQMIVVDQNDWVKIKKNLVLHAEAFLRVNKVDLLLYDANISEVSIFESMGFKIQRSNFKDQDTKISKLMYKSL